MMQQMISGILIVGVTTKDKVVTHRSAMALTTTRSTKHLLSRLGVSVFFLAILVSLVSLLVKLRLRVIQYIGLRTFGFQGIN